LAPYRRALARTGISLVGGLVLAGALAAPAPASTDPRGANLLPDAPGFSGDRAAPVVSLTFDDGPHPEFTPPILDILRDKGAKATFFELGRQAEAHPDLVRRIVAEGHTIGNHTWNHVHLRGLSEDRFRFEVDHSAEVLQSISGQEVVCTRPPYGDADPATVQRLAAHGQASVVWSADSQDYEKPGVAAIVANALKGLRPGGIILFHDGGGNRAQTIAALPQVIDQIRARGYEIVPACSGGSHRPSGEMAAVSEVPETLHVSGWARDPDTDQPLTVRVTVDGEQVAELTADTARAEGGRAFDTTVPAAPGDRKVCATAVNAGLGTGDGDLGCTTVSVAKTPWYDSLGRALGLLDDRARFEEPGAVPADGALSALVQVLFPSSR
jgi:peptidoglycan/xylan/chitin deacetylase (PgdA/CDA1 family)